MSSRFRKYDEVIEIEILFKNASKLYYDIISIYFSISRLRKDEEALTLLEQELLMSYIPYKYVEQFNTTYDYLIRKERKIVNKHQCLVILLMKNCLQFTKR